MLEDMKKIFSILALTLEDMKKIFSILALTLVALTASAKSDVFNLKDATATADKHGQVTFL